GWCGFWACRRTTRRDTVASCPPPRGGQGLKHFPSSSRRGGAKRRGGVGFGFAVGPPSATLSRPALLHEEGKVQNIPLLVEEGWREATGWCGFWVCRKTTLRDTVASCPPPRGGQSAKHSPPRRGGVARSDGVMGFNAAGPPSATPSRPALLHEEGKVQDIPLLVEEGWREATGWCGFWVCRRTTLRDTVASCPPSQ